MHLFWILVTFTHFLSPPPLPSFQPLHPTSFSPFWLFFPTLVIECYVRVLVSFQLHLFIYFWRFRICALHISASLSLLLIPQTCKRCLFRLSLSWKTERCCHWAQDSHFCVSVTLVQHPLESVISDGKFGMLGQKYSEPTQHTCNIRTELRSVISHAAIEMAS